jgi:hypothetical protein
MDCSLNIGAMQKMMAWRLAYTTQQWGIIIPCWITQTNGPPATRGGGKHGWLAVQALPCSLF